MKEDIKRIIGCLEQTPLILEHFLLEIPREVLKKKRIKNKWSIHEHVCHLVEAEQMIFARFQDFYTLNVLKFHPYLPDKTVSSNHFLEVDLKKSLEDFKNLRASLIELVKTFDDSIWLKKAKHPEYYKYDAYILLRHTLMHDHFHMYRIEELWLTKEEYL